MKLLAVKSAVGRSGASSSRRVARHNLVAGRRHRVRSGARRVRPRRRPRFAVAVDALGRGADRRAVGDQADPAVTVLIRCSTAMRAPPRLSTVTLSTPSPRTARSSSTSGASAAAARDAARADRRAWDDDQRVHLAGAQRLHGGALAVKVLIGVGEQHGMAALLQHVAACRARRRRRTGSRCRRSTSPTAWVLPGCERAGDRVRDVAELRARRPRPGAHGGADVGRSHPAPAPRWPARHRPARRRRES